MNYQYRFNYSFSATNIYNRLKKLICSGFTFEIQSSLFTEFIELICVDLFLQHFIKMINIHALQLGVLDQRNIFKINWFDIFLNLFIIFISVFRILLFSVFFLGRLFLFNFQFVFLKVSNVNWEILPFLLHCLFFESALADKLPDAVQPFFVL